MILCEVTEFVTIKEDGKSEGGYIRIPSKAIKISKLSRGVWHQRVGDPLVDHAHPPQSIKQGVFWPDAIRGVLWATPHFEPGEVVSLTYTEEVQSEGLSPPPRRDRLPR